MASVFLQPAQGKLRLPVEPSTMYLPAVLELYAERRKKLAAYEQSIAEDKELAKLQAVFNKAYKKDCEKYNASLAAYMSAVKEKRDLPPLLPEPVLKLAQPSDKVQKPKQRKCSDSYSCCISFHTHSSRLNKYPAGLDASETTLNEFVNKYNLVGKVFSIPIERMMSAGKYGRELSAKHVEEVKNSILINPVQFVCVGMPDPAVIKTKEDALACLANPGLSNFKVYTLAGQHRVEVCSHMLLVILLMMLQLLTHCFPQAIKQCLAHLQDEEFLQKHPDLLPKLERVRDSYKEIMCSFYINVPEAESRVLSMHFNEQELTHRKVRSSHFMNHDERTIRIRISLTLYHSGSFRIAFIAR